MRWCASHVTSKLLKIYFSQLGMNCKTFVAGKDLQFYHSVCVRVGAPAKIFKPHSQISRLGMWTICFPIYTKGLFIGLFF